MSFAVFSSHVNANAPDSVSVHVNSNIVTNIDGAVDFGEFTFVPHDGTAQTDEVQKQVIFSNMMSDIERTSYYYVGHENATPIAKAGMNTSFRLNNCYERMLFLKPSNNTAKYFSFGDSAFYSNNVSAVIYYSDGSTENLGASYVKQTSGEFDLVTDNFKPIKDVWKVCFITSSGFPAGPVSAYFDYNGTYYYTNVTVYYGEWVNDNGFTLVTTQESEESSWLGKIWNQLKTGFSDLVTSIKELPSKIWDFIESGLIGLFVPDDGFFKNWFDRMWDLYLEKTGVMGQCVEAIHRVVDAIAVFEPSDTIELPVVTIPLPEDNEFTFGGYDVKIVPDGFDFLIATVKTVLSIVCTVAFFGGMRQRYDEFVGVEK